MDSAAQDDAPDPALAFLSEREAGAPLAVMAFRALLEIQPLFEPVVSAARRHDAAFWADAEARCREILFLFDGDRQKFHAGVSQWVEFSYEFLAKQRKFLKSGRYAGESFEAVRHDLYDDDERMTNFYLIALMFSFLFSSNYAGFFAFFREKMLPLVRGAGSVCDVGCGHGVYLSQMLTAEPGAAGIGVDISPGSLATTARLLSFHEVGEGRCRLALGDVQRELPLADASQDAVTCFEVIEHLERPAAALAELRRVLRPGGTLCMSTAIRMESVDHIHLFRSPDEVREMVTAAGFTIRAEEPVPLTTEDLTDPEVRDRLIADPDTPLGFVILAS